MTADEIKKLRKKAKHLMVELEIDRGYKVALAAELTVRMKRPVSHATLVMALSGHRETAPYQEVLQELTAMLAERKRALAPLHNTHPDKTQSNCVAGM